MEEEEEEEEEEQEEEDEEEKNHLVFKLLYENLFPVISHFWTNLI